ncbi:MAG TPA: family 10 glycosylhydrolase [bacterium]|nr:family 10 glycosylhydrolase [bacterium]
MKQHVGCILFLFLSWMGVALPAAGKPMEKPSARVRGVWMHPGFFGPDKSIAKEKMQATLDAYAQAGINTLFILVKNTTGHVYFNSEIGQRDNAYDWDFFALFLSEAEKRKMEVHPWFCVFPEIAMLGQVGRHPEWLISNPKREMVAVANPALPAVRAYEKSMILELAQKYAVRWVHLDYIRYPCEPVEPYFSFDRETLRLFKEDTGIDLTTVKNRDTGSIAWNEWLHWNRERVTLFIRELRTGLDAINRKVKISAAVFNDAATARIMVGQDWVTWAQEGLVDMVSPMLYTDRCDHFEKKVRQAMADRRGRVQLCPGIGVGSNSLYQWASPESMIKQIAFCDSINADGVVFFSSYSLDQPFLEKLQGLK